MPTWTELYNHVRDVVGEQPTAGNAAKMTYVAIGWSAVNGVKLSQWPVLRAEALVLSDSDNPTAPAQLDPQRRMSEAAARQWWHDVAAFADVAEKVASDPQSLIEMMAKLPDDPLGAGALQALDHHRRAQVQVMPSNMTGAIVPVPAIAPASHGASQDADAVPPDPDTRGHGDAGAQSSDGPSLLWLAIGAYFLFAE